MRRFLACALVALSVACSGERAPTPDSGTLVEITFPADGQPLPKGELRIEGDLVAFFDTGTRFGVASKYKVFDGATDVTSQAAFLVREPRFARIFGNEITPVMSPQDPIALTTMIGTKVGNKVGYAHLVMVQQARSGARLDATVVAPHNAPPSAVTVPVKGGGGLYSVDVAIVMDTTQTMFKAIDELKTNLQKVIVPELDKTIPDVAFGLVEFKDFPVLPYGEGSDFAANVRQRMTSDPAVVLKAMDKMVGRGGADIPESHIAAMMHALTGVELKWAGGSLPPVAASGGKFGGVGFRNGALPVVILVTDADWHAPEKPLLAYDSSKVMSNFSMTDIADAFVKTNARFVSISAEGAEGQANELSDKTGSLVPHAAFKGVCEDEMCCTGVDGKGRDPLPDGRCRLNFLHSEGGGLSRSIVKAINGLAVGSVFDAGAAAGVSTALPDASKLVRAVRLLPAGNSTLGCGPQTEKDTDGDGKPDSYSQVPVKTSVCFEVDVAGNTEIAPGIKPLIFGASVNIVGQPGNVLLDRRTIVFVVPPAP